MSTTHRLLVVEDDSVVLGVLNRLLVREYEVHTRSNGQDALDSFQAGEYAAALIDLGLPGLSGDQVAHEIRRRDPAVSRILITGWALESEDPRLEVFDFRLEKPLDMQQLQRVVASAVEQHRARRRQGAG